MTSTTSGAARIEDVLALSPLQKGLYAFARLTEKGAIDPYVIAVTAEVSGPLDAELLRQCATKMLKRHPNLRASFRSCGLPHPVQVVPAQVHLPWKQLTATPQVATDLEAEERRRGFDLEHGPAIRFMLLELPDACWRFLITAHHILIDGWSLNLFLGELLSLYKAGGDMELLPPPPRPYRDYIGWLAGRDPRQSELIWREHLDGLAAPTMLSPALGVSSKRAYGLPTCTQLSLDRAATTQLVEHSRGRGVTVNTLIQVAWALVLSAYTDQDDVVFGMAVSGRPAELRGVESMVGLFVNTIPLRIRFDPKMTVGQHCSTVQREAARLREHAYVDHARLRALGGLGELFDTLLVHENFPSDLFDNPQPTQGPVTFRASAVESVTHFPITVTTFIANGQFTLVVEAAQSALGPNSAGTLGRHVLVTLDRLLKSWDRPWLDISVLCDDEIDRLHSDQPMVDAPDHGGVHVVFAEVAAARAEAVALSWDGGQITYAELDRAADRLAAELVQRGVEPETPVAIRLRRGPAYVIAMLGVLKAGGLFVPLDRDMPQDRVALMLGQSGARIVLDDGDLASLSAPEVRQEFSQGRRRNEFRPRPAHFEQAAYVLFTSGTTGEPKGVVGLHGALLAYADDHAERLLRPAAARLGRQLHVAHVLAFTFDASWQLWGALLDGHTVHIVDDNVRRDPEALVEVIAASSIDMIDVTPSLFGPLRGAGLLDTVPLAVLSLGGEAVGPAIWSDVRAVCSRTGMSAFNCYGPTETTVDATVAQIADYDEPTIGFSTRGTHALLFDSWMRPVPDGAVGELYVAGVQLTRGYLGRPGETSARFVADPSGGGGRIYRTGDLVRRTKGGALQFVGRSDAQVKIRGYRVEPAEIEAILVAHPGVADARVRVTTQSVGPRIVAYLASTTPPPIAQLRALVRSRLPPYMVPHRFEWVEKIPLTAHGKLDETALSTVNQRAESARGTETSTEATLAQVVAEVLNEPEIDVDADFVQLGLDSIVAFSVVQESRRRGLPLRARLILECDTIRQVATAIDAGIARAELESDQFMGPIPLLPAARWLCEHGVPRRFGHVEIIELPDGIDADQLRLLLDTVVAGHEVLTCRLDKDTMTFVPCPDAHWPLTECAVTDVKAAVAEHARRALERLDPEHGSLLAAVLLHAPEQQDVLLLAGHVLALDPASWGIVLREIDAGRRAMAAGRQPTATTEHTSYRAWYSLLAKRAASLDTLPFWLQQLDGEDPLIGARRVRPGLHLARDLVSRVSITPTEVTAAVLTAGLPVQHILIATAALTVTEWRRRRGQPLTATLLGIETHGRADAVAPQADTADTVGLLSASYPLRIPSGEPAAVIAAVAELLANLPGSGIDYGLLRYLCPDASALLQTRSQPQLLLNYMGRTDQLAVTGLRRNQDLLAAIPALHPPELTVRHELTVIAAIFNIDGAPVVISQWRTPIDILCDAEVTALQEIWEAKLVEVTGTMRRL